MTAEPEMFLAAPLFLRISSAGSHDEPPQNAPSRVKPRKAEAKLQCWSLIMAGKITPRDEKVDAVIRKSRRDNAPRRVQERHWIVDIAIEPPCKLAAGPPP